MLLVIRRRFGEGKKQIKNKTRLGYRYCTAQLGSRGDWHTAPLASLLLAACLLRYLAGDRRMCRTVNHHRAESLFFLFIRGGGGILSKVCVSEE